MAIEKQVGDIQRARRYSEPTGLSQNATHSSDWKALVYRIDKKV